MQYSDIEVSPLKGHRYVVLKDITFKGITVPKGYITNGADVPRWLWWYQPPNDSDILPAVIFHDYLCSLEMYGLAEVFWKDILTVLKIKYKRRRRLVKSTGFYAKYIRPFFK